MIGKIRRVGLREVWPHEARHFTTWLQENIDALDDVLDFTLSGAEREQSAGDFSVDLIAKDEGGKAVIIENQFGKSDHDHLGKLITYSTVRAAKKAIWIVGEARPEHVQAVSQLNESKTTAFYLVKLEAIRISDSLPAPLFTLIVGPSEEARKIGDIKKKEAEAEVLRRQFWTQLLEQAKKKTSLHSNTSPGNNHWIETTAGKRGLRLNYVILKNDSAVELYIDRGKNSDKENKALFDQLFKYKKDIQIAFEDNLEWQRLDGKRACRIKRSIQGGGLADQEKWPEIQSKMIDTMIRFEKALRPFISKLTI